MNQQFWTSSQKVIPNQPINDVDFAADPQSQLQNAQSQKSFLQNREI